MSSTNRGCDRHKSDYYVTPIKPIEKFLEQFRYKEFYFADMLNNGLILDPCAGGDKGHGMSYPKAIKSITENFNYPITNDIRKDSLAYLNYDYLSMDVVDCIDKVPDIIISNPPFRDAMDFIKKSLEDVKLGGYVIYLLRLNFFGSKKKYKLWQNYMPKYTYVHHKRMLFTDEGGTDSIEYAHFVWQKGKYPEFSRIKVI